MTLFQAFGQFAGQAAIVASDLQFITSSSLNTSTITLDNVFTADYDNYLFVVDFTGTGTSTAAVEFLYRTGGSTSGSTNDRQEHYADGTGGGGSRITSTTLNRVMRIGSASGAHIWVYNPYLTMTTTSVSLTQDLVSNVRLFNYASITRDSTSYDGVEIAFSGAIPGDLVVYGMVK